MDDLTGKGSKAWMVFQECYKFYDKTAKAGVPDGLLDERWDDISGDAIDIFNKYSDDPVRELAYGITSGILDYFQELAKR